MKLRLILVFIFFVLIGILGVIGYKLMTKSPGKQITNIIQNVVRPNYSIETAPSESIRGTIIKMDGEVKWESRVATEAAIITSPRELQQGEEIDTGDSGNVAMEFPGAADITMSPKTQIDFVQTLPASFVISEASGSADIKKMGSVPVSIRVLHLLVKQNDGELSIGVDNHNSLINLNIISGSITIAFNDLNLVSKEMNFVSGQRITFSDLTRSFSL